MDTGTRIAFEQIHKTLDRLEDKLDRLAHGQVTLSHNQRILKDQATMNADEELAKIEAQGTVLAGLQTSVDVLRGPSATIADEIARIKAENPAVDFTRIDAALEANNAILDGLVPAVKANTPENGVASRR